MAHIQKLGPHKYKVRYRGPDKRERSKTFRKRTDAEGYKATVESDLVRGSWRDPKLGRRTFSNWANEYFAGSVHKRASTMARDVTVYRQHLRPAFGEMPISLITPLDVRRFVERLSTKLAPSTVRTTYGVLRAILNAAVYADLLVASPCRGIKLPPERVNEKRRLTAEELVSLADEVPSEYCPTIYLAGVLGLRWSEVAGLRVGRIDFLRKTLTVTETVSEVGGVLTPADVKSRASRRTLDVPPFLIDLLAEHLARTGRRDPEAYVFQAPGGGALRGTNFRSRTLNPAVRAAGLAGLTFHGLRHSAAGLMRQVGAHPQAIRQRMGHASGGTVTEDVYGWVTPASDAAVTDGLEALFSAASGLSAASGDAD